MNRRGFLLGAGAAAAAASLPGRAVASIIESAEPVIGTVPAATYGSISAATSARVMRDMLRHLEPQLWMCRLGTMIETPKGTGPALTFRRPPPFQPEGITDA